MHPSFSFSFRIHVFLKRVLYIITYYTYPNRCSKQFPGSAGNGDAAGTSTTIEPTASTPS